MNLALGWRPTEDRNEPLLARTVLGRVAESAQHGSALYDRISHFEVGIDRLDLRGIGASVLQAGDQAFTVVNAFSGSAGQLMITAPVGTGDGLESSLLRADLASFRFFAATGAAVGQSLGFILICLFSLYPREQRIVWRCGTVNVDATGPMVASFEQDGKVS